MVLVGLPKETSCSDPPEVENGLYSYNNPVFADESRTAYKYPSTERADEKVNYTNSKMGSQVSIASINTYCDTKEYDPYDYCTVNKPISYGDTVLHLLKAAIGTGILAIPNAYKDAGYTVGAVGVFLVAFLYAISVHMLVSAEYELCKRKRIPNLSYANTVHAAFADGPKELRWLAGCGRFFANFFFMVYESGGCAIYIVFISSNMKQLLDYYLDTNLEVRTLIVYVTIPLIMMCWIRNLKILAPLSAAANIITVVCFVLVFWYVFREPPTFAGKLPGPDSITKLPVYLTTVLFAIASTGIILPLKSEMRKPKQFGSPAGVLNMAMIPISVLYATFGFVGYLKYGNKTAGSITLNLPQDELLAQGIKGLYSLSIFLCYFLCFYVVLDIVWKNYLKDKVQKNNLFWEYVVRTTIPVFTFLLAYAIPNLEIFISLVGAIGISTTSLVIPVIVHTLVFWDHFKTPSAFRIFLVRNSVLLSISLVIFATGVYESVSDLVEMYIGKH